MSTASALSAARGVLAEAKRTPLRTADAALLAVLLDRLTTAADELLDQHGDRCSDPHGEHTVITGRTRTVVAEAARRPRPAPDLMVLAVHIGAVSGVLRLLVEHVLEVTR